METSMFDMAFSIQDNSRLSCQLKLDPKHEGLLVTLAPGTE
jgi:ferredoxin